MSSIQMHFLYLKLSNLAEIMELISAMIILFGVLIVTMQQMFKNTPMQPNVPVTIRLKVLKSLEMIVQNPGNHNMDLNQIAPIQPMKKNVQTKETIISIVNFLKLALAGTNYVMELFIV